ncbi:histidine phosphatase family protein [Hydrogenophaga sp. PAMC20947]|uniref:histidine phosphatase family protein n=1 Tax=Hydrogenophaga sp. PAMC20947 TaxID=2565558 RepID=UPI00109D9EF1|nr:histidine phosphatase family protein [Hydrogenophaga sp. PAMC20947]QCB45769.1 phosphoglycerate kinase [Hydrogenophaga sp. PAMC20947]
MKLWLLRHAPVVLEAGLCYGASDVPADAALTLLAAEKAAAFLPPGLPVWTSALGRTRQLGADLQCLRPDLSGFAQDPRLNEMDFGQWELQPWSAIPRAAFDAWMADFAHHRFGGVESTRAILARVALALGSLRERGLEEAVWVTHAGVIRSVAYLADVGQHPLTMAEQWPREAPEPGGYIQITL